MPQDNFNPEKEPTPERKWWNVFERLSEFEEPEKDKQPEKQTERAKELKSAAKDRGHFWESFMPHRDENNGVEVIAPKGEKVRKKWRALLRRKSETQVEEFKAEEPEIIDSYWLAQLMVAERILTLHTQLAESEPKTNERRQIKTELDVLGLLSEKLSDPEVEVPAEIEQTYQVIVSVLEQGDHSIEVEELPVIKDSPENSPEQLVETRERSFQKYGAAVVVALKLAVRNKKPEPEDEPHPQPVLPPLQGRGMIPTDPVVSNPVEVALTPHQTPKMAPGMVLTSAVILAEYSVRKDEKQALMQSPPPEFQPWSPNQVHSSVPVDTVSTLPTETRPQPSRLEQLPVTPEVTLPISNRKFEHMKTEELLQLARSVPLGNGEYLARAYQSGKIDREGLIKVLKAYSRRGNYHEEYRRYSGEYQRRLTLEIPPRSEPIAVTSEQTIISSHTKEQSDSHDVVRKYQAQHSPPRRTNQTPPIFSVKAMTVVLILIIGVTLIVLL